MTVVLALVQGKGRGPSDADGSSNASECIEYGETPRGVLPGESLFFTLVESYIFTVLSFIISYVESSLRLNKY